MSAGSPNGVARQLVTAMLIVRGEAPGFGQATEAKGAAREWLEALSAYDDVLREALEHIEDDSVFAEELVGELVGFVASLVELRALVAICGDPNILGVSLPAGAALEWWGKVQLLLEEGGRR